MPEINSKKIFLVVFPLVLFFQLHYPDLIWFTQIIVFLSMVLLIGLNFSKKPSFLFSLLVLSLIPSTYFSINKISSVPVFFSYIIIFLISSLFFEDKKRTLLNGYVAGIILIGFLSVVYSILKISFTVFPTFFRSLDSYPSLIIPYFGHAFYAVLIVSILPYILHKLTSAKETTIWSVIYPLIILFLFAAFSKLAILVTLVEILFYFILLDDERKKSIILKYIIPPIFISFFLYILVATNILKIPWLYSKISKPSLESRLEYWHQDWKIISNTPWERLIYGYGLDNFFELSNKYQSRPDYWARSSHNFFIQFLIENGIISTILLITYLILTLFRNFKYYSLYEKVSIFALLAYSFGGTVDLKLFPALLLFFILLQKQKNKDNYRYSDKENRYKYFWLTIIVILMINWVRFLYVNRYLLNNQKPEIKSIQIFPYEYIFWEKMIENSVNEKKDIITISDLLAKYASINIFLNKALITKSQNIGEYCSALDIAKKYLSLAPYDLELQNDLIESLYSCTEVNKEEMVSYFHYISMFYILNWKERESMIPFMLSVARFNFIHFYFDEYIRWMDKIWIFDLNNPTDIWTGENFRDSRNAISINSPFKIIFAMENFGGPAGVGLLGEGGKEHNDWRQDRKLFIGLKDNGSILYIYIYDGIAKDEIVLLEKRIDPALKIGELHIFFDEKGRQMDITDRNGNYIARIDINQLTNNRFPQGFFPNREIYLSYSVAPKSYLSINKFLILPLPIN